SMKDYHVENHFKRENVRYHREEHIPLPEIDWELSQRNQARLGKPIDQHHVDDLCLAILEGKILDDPVGYRLGKKIVIISGNHRCCATKQFNEQNWDWTIPTLDWYIVDEDSDTIDTLTRTMNMDLIFKPISEEDRIKQALYLKTNKGMSITQVAKLVNVDKKVLSRAERARDTSSRLAKMNFTKEIPPSILEDMNRIKQDKPLLEVAKLYSKGALRGDTVVDISRRLVALANKPEEQTRELHRIEAEYRVPGQTFGGKSQKIEFPQSRLQAALTKILGIQPESVIPLNPRVLMLIRDTLKRLEEVIERDSAARQNH
ncbi:MAG: hypothetical protein MUO97_05870, partial [Dehalococcoidia bacterium]|nr:hypothetical protein [Dehalococcoidia bacterium]